MFWLTEDAVVTCTHENGIVQIPPTQDLVTIEDRRVYVDPDPESKSIVGCPMYGVGIKPCTTTLRVRVGYSDFIRIEGQRVCLDTVRGYTDGSPPGSAEYKVRRPGHDLVKEAP